MIKYKSSEERVIDASQPNKKGYVYAVLPEILATTGNETFLIAGRYEDENENVLKPIRTTMSLEDIDDLQEVLGITATKFSDLWIGVLTAGAAYKLNADANYGETNWQAMSEEEQAYMRMTDEEKAAYDAENETEILTEQ